MLFMGAAVGRGPQISSNSTLLLEVSGDLLETEPSGVLGQFLEGPPTVRSVVDALRKASVDRRVASVIIRPTGTAALWGKVQEVRDAITEFRKSKKPIVAFLESASDQSYYLASACDKVFLMPTASLDLTGMASYELFLRGALDKIGVLPDSLHVGDYKTASNTFTEHSFTPAHREMAESLNTDLYEQLVAGVAEGRHRTPAEVRAARSITGRTCRRTRFAPGWSTTSPTKTRSTTRWSSDAAARASCGSTNTERGLELARAESRSEDRGHLRDRPDQLRREQRVAVRAGAWARTRSSSTSRTARADSSIRAIVLRIDSPGGSAVASDIIWREIMLTRDRKPVIASMSDVAASGGYYIAMPAHAIVAQPATLTGSIGVVLVRFVMDGTLDKLGLNMETVKQGKYADIFSPVRPFSPDERKKVMELMQATYDAFVEKAAAGRNTTPERIDAIGQGRVWTGKQAKALGLVDELGGLDRAIELAKERAKIAAGSRSRAGGFSAEEIAVRSRQRSVGPIRERCGARRASRVEKRQSRRGAHRAAAPLPPRRAAGVDAECVREVGCSLLAVG